MTGRTLVAGIGNVFLGDDGFGVEVASRLRNAGLPPGVRVLDAGIRSRHLAYELLEGGYATVILVDAVQRGGAPGTLYVIEPELQERGGEEPAPDGHAMDPEAMLQFARALGAAPAQFLIVGCEPVSVDEGMGLSPPVAAAVDEAVAVVRELICA